MRRSTTLFFLLALLVGFTLFKVKYEVIEVEQKLTQVLTQIAQEKGNIHILKAEWSHLNEPQRLQKLAEKYLDITPMKTEQIAAVMQDGIGIEASSEFIPEAHLASMKGEE